jgi:DNA/RNA-binding domain of Phe-tRNA-synthetase-like protein
LNKIVNISPGYLDIWPTMKLGCISCNVNVEPSGEQLKQKMEKLLHALSITYEMQEIAQLPPIFYARKAYRTFGKDPARYRLSAESLLRRVTRGDDLFRINNVVDIVNMLSLLTGFSIGAYDAGKIEGNVSMGLGKIDELYDGVGRGWLNIENLPIIRDQIGPFGSPTTDSVRTSVTFNTHQFLMVFFDFGTPEKLEHAMTIAQEWLQNYAGANQFTDFIVS